MTKRVVIYEFLYNYLLYLFIANHVCYCKEIYTSILLRTNTIALVSIVCVLIDEKTFLPRVK